MLHFQVINSGKYDIYSTGKPDTDYNSLFIQDDLSKTRKVFCPEYTLPISVQLIIAEEQAMEMDTVSL